MLAVSADTESVNVFFRYDIAGHHTWQDQVEDRPPRIHHTARQAQHRNLIVRTLIGQHEHRARQHRRTIAHHPIRRLSDGVRGLVIRIDAHTTRAEHHIRPGRQHLLNACDLHLRIIRAVLMRDHLSPEGLDLCLHHWRKGILDSSVVHLIARRHDTHLFMLVWQDPEQRLISHELLHSFHLLLLDDQRDDPHPGHMLVLLYGIVIVKRSDHHLAVGIDLLQSSDIDLQKPVTVSDQLNFSFLDILVPAQMLVFAEIVQHHRRIVLMHHRFIDLPDVDMVLSDGKQHRHILLRDDMSLPEHRSFLYAPDDLCDIMTEHLAHRIFCFHQLHTSSPVF